MLVTRPSLMRLIPPPSLKPIHTLPSPAVMSDAMLVPARGFADVSHGSNCNPLNRTSPPSCPARDILRGPA
jgi:hypothetical protein